MNCYVYVIVRQCILYCISQVNNFFFFFFYQASDLLDVEWGMQKARNKAQYCYRGV